MNNIYNVPSQVEILGETFTLLEHNTKQWSPHQSLTQEFTLTNSFGGQLVFRGRAGDRFIRKLRKGLNL